VKLERLEITDALYFVRLL